MGKWFGSGWFGSKPQPISRREFLRRAATLGAAAATTNPLEALLDAVPTPAKPYSIWDDALPGELVDGFYRSNMGEIVAFDGKAFTFGDGELSISKPEMLRRKAMLEEARDALHLADPSQVSYYNFDTKQWHAPFQERIGDQWHKRGYMKAGLPPPEGMGLADMEPGQYKDLLNEMTHYGTLTTPGPPQHVNRGIARKGMNQIDALEADWHTDRRLFAEELLQKRDLTPEQREQLQQYNADLGRYPSSRNDNIPPTLLEQGLLDEFDGLRYEDPVDEFKRGATPRRLKNPRQPPTGPSLGALSALMDEQEQMYA